VHSFRGTLEKRTALNQGLMRYLVAIGKLDGKEEKFCLPSIVEERIIITAVLMNGGTTGI